MKASDNKRISAAINELENALRDESLNGNFKNNHASLFILQPGPEGKGTLCASFVIGCTCQTCLRIVSKSAAANLQSIIAEQTASVH